MERLNRLTSQQLIIAASSAVLVGGVYRSVGLISLCRWVAMAERPQSAV